MEGRVRIPDHRTLAAVLSSSWRSGLLQVELLEFTARYLQQAKGKTLVLFDAVKMLQVVLSHQLVGASSAGGKERDQRAVQTCLSWFVDEIMHGDMKLDNPSSCSILCLLLSRAYDARWISRSQRDRLPCWLC